MRGYAKLDHHSAICSRTVKLFTPRATLIARHCRVYSSIKMSKRGARYCSTHLSGTGRALSQLNFVRLMKVSDLFTKLLLLCEYAGHDQSN